MEQDKLTASPPTPLLGGEGGGVLMAEEGASLSSGSLRLYYLLPSPRRRGSGGEAAGCIDLYNYDPLNHRCAVGIMVATEHRRQGHALAMLQKLSSFILQLSSIHTLYADIAATNTASLALFAKAGYEECGHFKEWLYIGERLKVKGETTDTSHPSPLTSHLSSYVDSIRMQKIL